jgi:hypothetical protein
MNLSEESKKALLRYWENERSYARDCRGTQTHVTKDIEKYKRWDARYKIMS